MLVRPKTELRPREKTRQCLTTPSQRTMALIAEASEIRPAVLLEGKKKQKARQEGQQGTHHSFFYKQSFEVFLAEEAQNLMEKDNKQQTDKRTFIMLTLNATPRMLSRDKLDTRLPSTTTDSLTCPHRSTDRRCWYGDSSSRPAHNKLPINSCSTNRNSSRF